MGVFRKTSDKLCTFHEDYGHLIEDCIYLKVRVDTQMQWGELSKYMEDTSSIIVELPWSHKSLDILILCLQGWTWLLEVAGERVQQEARKFEEIETISLEIHHKYIITFLLGGKAYAGSQSRCCMP